MKTYAMNGVNPNPHEHYSFIWDLLQLPKVVYYNISVLYYTIGVLLFHSRANPITDLPGGIPVINVDFSKQNAYFFVDHKQVFLGSSIANEYLRLSSEDQYIVDLASDWELTLFNIKRDKYGMWHAKDKRIKGIDLLLGTSESITYEKIVLAERFFLSQRTDVPENMSNDNNASLAFEVLH